MKRGRNITPAQRREWLEEHDRGETYADIADRSGRDARTIRTQVERATREREARLARRDQIRRALDKHNKQLVQVAKSLRDNFRFLPDEQFTPIPAFPRSNLTTASVGRFMIDRDTLAVAEIDQDPRSSKLEGLLREHLRDEAILWRDMGVWHDSHKEYIEECLRLGADVARRLTEKTQLQPVEEGGTATGFQEAMVSWACRLMIEAAGPQGRKPALELVTEVGELRFGGATFARASSDDQLERARQAFMDVLEEIRLSSGVQKIARLKEDLNSRGESIRDRLEDILLFEFISGKCRVCDRHAI